MRRLNIRWRLTLWFGAAMMLLLLIRSFWIYFLMDWRLTAVIDARLNANLDALESQVGNASDRKELVAALEKYATRHGDLEIKIAAPDQNVLFVSPAETDTLPTSFEKLWHSQPGRRHLTKTNKTGRHRTVLTTASSAIGPLSIEIGRSTLDKRNEVWDFALTLLTTLPMVFLAAVGVGYFVSSRALTPIDKMISAAEQITVRRLDQRIDVPESRDELARLARTLNEMIDRLHRSFEEMRRFTADAAHDLRTPVTALRTEVEVSLMADQTTEEYRNSLKIVLEEAIHLSRLTNQLLDLSREDHGVEPSSGEPVRVDQILETAIEDLHMASNQKQITIETGPIGAWTVPGDAVRLRRMFMNLLDNAIQYTPSGGRVRIEGEYLPDRARLIVADNGPGIPPEDLPHIFDRFRRVDKARSRHMGGTGLGLAICKSIVEAHQGTIRMESTLGAGTRVIVELPRSSAAAAAIS